MAAELHAWGMAHPRRSSAEYSDAQRQRDHDLLSSLRACHDKLAGTAPVIAAALAKQQGHADAMCACKDAACAAAVLNASIADPGQDPNGPWTDSDRRRSSALSLRFVDCMTAARSAGTVSIAHVVGNHATMNGARVRTAGTVTPATQAVELATGRREVQGLACTAKRCADRSGCCNTCEGGVSIVDGIDWIALVPAPGQPELSCGGSRCAPYCTPPAGGRIEASGTLRMPSGFGTDRARGRRVESPVTLAHGH